jgi:hypothetical protein
MAFGKTGLPETEGARAAAVGLADGAEAGAAVGVGGAVFVGAGAVAAALASEPHWALRKSFHFIPLREPAVLAASYLVLHSFMVSAEAGPSAARSAAVASVMLVTLIIGVLRPVLIHALNRVRSAGHVKVDVGNAQTGLTFRGSRITV